MLFLVVAVVLAYAVVVLPVYRLYFHPLAAFPGPKFAAGTGWYEFFYDILCKGQFIWKIEQLHEQYGWFSFFFFFFFLVLSGRY